MILNEDFFDDIEIKDDDLKNDSEQELYNSKDIKSLITDMFSSYKQCLCFEFSTPFDENTHTQNLFDKNKKDNWNLFDKTNKWDLFRDRIRRACRLFDAYCIKYSEPLFCTMTDWNEIRYKEFDNNWNIIDIKNNKVIVNADNIDLYKNLNLNNGLYAFMFIDLPVFNSAKGAYRFLYRMANSLYNMIYNRLDAVVVYHLNKDEQSQCVINDNDLKIYLNDSRIKAIIKPTMWWIKDNISYLLSPQYKYRHEFDNAQTEIELQDFIKNH